jgi:hypothetical protein
MFLFLKNKCLILRGPKNQYLTNFIVLEVPTKCKK